MSALVCTQSTAALKPVAEHTIWHGSQKCCAQVASRCEKPTQTPGRQQARRKHVLTRSQPGQTWALLRSLRQWGRSTKTTLAWPFFFCLCSIYWLLAAECTRCFCSYFRENMASLSLPRSSGDFPRNHYTMDIAASRWQKNKTKHEQ